MDNDSISFSQDILSDSANYEFPPFPEKIQNIITDINDLKIKIQNQTGINTGDETQASITSKLGYIPASNTIESRHYVGNTGEPAFQNSWANYDANHKVFFYKDNMGIVHLEGMITGGSIQTVVFTLPVGYRPTNSNVCFITSNNFSTSFTGFNITNDGRVIAQTFTTNINISLDGISFRAGN